MKLELATSGPRSLCRAIGLSFALLCSFLPACAQQTPVFPDDVKASKPEVVYLTPTLARMEGLDAASGLSFVRVFLIGTMSKAEPARLAPATGAVVADAQPLSAPTLTGQCTRDPAGHLRFELFANFGDVADAAFYPPWQGSAQNLFPPVTPKVQVRMDFLGYRRVSPFKREFESVVAPGPAQLRYMPPGGASSNLEPPGWFFQYLRSLPTLRLAAAGHSAEFETAPWLLRLHAEPLCGASGA